MPTGRRRIGSGPIEPVDAERTLEVTQGLAVWTVGWGLQARGVAPLGLARRGERAATRVQGPAMNRAGLHRTAGCIEGAASNRVCIEQGLHRTGVASGRAEWNSQRTGSRRSGRRRTAGRRAARNLRQATSSQTTFHWATFRWATFRWPTFRWPTFRWPTFRWPTFRWPTFRWAAFRLATRDGWAGEGRERGAPPAPRPRPPSTLLDARLRHRVAAERSLLGAFTCPLRGAHDRRQAFGVGR